jgi:peptidoglycan/LPS O-acetylase OafA/YrhL
MGVSVTMIMYGAALIFMMVCIGTVMGALSEAKSDKKKAKTMGLTAFAFCMLAVLFGGGGAVMSKFGAHNAPAS